MSTLEANTVKPISGSSTLTLGEPGDTVTLGAGASSSGFGATLTGSTNNTVVTVTGANAMAGEAKLTFDGTTLTANNTTGTSATVENLVITTDTDANPAYANIKFTSGTGGNVAGAWIKGVQASGGNDGRLEFHTNNAGTVTEALRITYDQRGISQWTATAWCYANGTGTPAIVDSYNVSSLSDHETGQLGMNFTNNMATNNYVPIVNAWQGYAYTFGAMDTYTHTFKATCSNGSSYTDVNRVNMLVFGDM